MYVNHKSLIRMKKSPSDNIMQGVFDDKGFSVQAEGNVYESSSDMPQNGRIFEQNSYMNERVICHCGQRL